MFPSDTRILLVDDMSTTRKFICHHLTKMGYGNFFEAPDGEAAFQLLLSMMAKAEPIGLVFCDIVMPKLTGIELVRRLRATPDFVRLPILMVTAELDSDLQEQAKKAGVNDYLTKPFTGDILKSKISSVWKSFQAAQT